MRKFLRGLLITSLSLIVIGVISTTICLSAGGLRQLTGQIVDGAMVLRDNIVELWRTIPGVERINGIESIKVNVEGFGLDLQVNDLYEIHEGDFTDDQVAKGADLSAIDISAMGNTLKIMPSDTEYVKLETTNAEKFQYYVENGCLSLHVLPRISDTKVGNSEVLLYIPQDVQFTDFSCILGAGDANIDIPVIADNVNCTVGAGKFTSTQCITAGNLRVSIGAGTVHLSEISTTGATFDLGAGEVIVSKGDLDNVSIRVGMGNAEYNGSVSSKMNIDCGMGNVSVVLDKTQSDYDYSISGAAGNVAIASDLFSGVAMQRNIDNGADTDISVNCAMGNVSISFPE